MKKSDGAVFLARLTQELVKNLPNWYGSDNWDTEVLPYQESLEDRIFTLFRKIIKLLFKNSILIKQKDYETVVSYLSNTENSILEMSKLYRLLQDDYSRSLLVSLIAYRLMGYRKVKLPLNTTAYWETRKTAQSLIRGRDKIKIGFRDWSLSRMNISEFGYPLELYLMPVWATTTFSLKQYEYTNKTIKIKAETGDYVIDAGGGWGDTALYFAHTVGKKGKVYTFEFSPDNLEVLRQNLQLNPDTAKNIQIIQNALWDKSHEVLDFSINGPATTINKSQDNQEAALHISTLTLDDFVTEVGLERVDFIKMDIEGAELKALIGAQKTISAFKPKLAISIYHNPDDFIKISSYLDSFKLGYKFFLNHFTIYRGETILFAYIKS